MRSVDAINASRMFSVSELDGMEALRATYTTHRFAPHFHPTYLIGATSTGIEEFDARGGLHRSPQGALRLFNPGEVHTGSAGAGGRWSYCAIYPPMSLVDRAVRELRGKPRRPYFRDMVVDDRALAGALRGAFAALEAEGSTLTRETLLLTLLVEVIARHGHSRMLHPALGREHRAVGVAKSFITDNLDRNFSLAELAAAARLSPYYLVRIFQRDVAMTPSQFRTQARVERAKTLIASGAKLGSITQACGFFDQSHLSRAFRAIVGVTPRDYAQITRRPERGTTRAH